MKVRNCYFLYSFQIHSFTLKNFSDWNMFMILLLLLVFCSPLAVRLGVKQCFCEETGYFKGWTHQGMQEAGLLHTPTLGRVAQQLTLFLTSTWPKFPDTFSVRCLNVFKEGQKQLVLTILCNLITCLLSRSYPRTRGQEERTKETQQAEQLKYSCYLHLLVYSWEIQIRNLTSEKGKISDSEGCSVDWSHYQIHF